MNGTTEKGLYLQLVMDYGSSKIPVPDWLTEDWCKWFIAQFLEAYPEIQEYFDRMWYRARRYGMAWDSFGRVKLLPELKSYHSWVRSSGLRQAQNMPVTSMAAGQLKLIMGKTDETLQQLYDAGVWCWPLLTIHDAVMVEVEEEYAEDVDQTLAYDFDNCMRDEQTGVELSRVPIKSDGDVIDYDETGKSRWKK
jgi:DNA polymerase I-like protein with 3'-5' exonuclease and polymerase domains